MPTCHTLRMLRTNSSEDFLYCLSTVSLCLCVSVSLCLSVSLSLCLSVSVSLCFISIGRCRYGTKHVKAADVLVLDVLVE